MKISSASKKVLASALSAAMVVAFAPTVAFGAPAANDPAVVKLVVKTGPNAVNGVGADALTLEQNVVLDSNKQVKVGDVDLTNANKYTYYGQGITGWYYDKNANGAIDTDESLVSSDATTLNAISVDSSFTKGGTIQLIAKYALAEVTFPANGFANVASGAANIAFTAEIADGTYDVKATKDGAEIFSKANVDVDDKLVFATTETASEVGTISAAGKALIAKSSFGEGKYSVTFTDKTTNYAATAEFNLYKVTLAVPDGRSIFASPTAVTEYFVSDKATGHKLGNTIFTKIDAVKTNRANGTNTPDESTGWVDASGEAVTANTVVTASTTFTSEYADPKVGKPTVDLTAGTIAFAATNLTAVAAPGATEGVKDYTVEIDGPGVSMKLAGNHTVADAQTLHFGAAYTTSDGKIADDVYTSAAPQAGTYTYKLTQNNVDGTSVVIGTKTVELVAVSYDLGEGAWLDVNKKDVTAETLKTLPTVAVKGDTLANSYIEDTANSVTQITLPTLADDSLNGLDKWAVSGLVTGTPEKAVTELVKTDGNVATAKTYKVTGPVTFKAVYKAVKLDKPAVSFAGDVMTVAVAEGTKAYYYVGSTAAWTEYTAPVTLKSTDTQVHVKAYKGSDASDTLDFTRVLAKDSAPYKTNKQAIASLTDFATPANYLANSDVYKKAVEAADATFGGWNLAADWTKVDYTATGTVMGAYADIAEAAIDAYAAGIAQADGSVKKLTAEKTADAKAAIASVEAAWLTNNAAKATKDLVAINGTKPADLDDGKVLATYTTAIKTITDNAAKAMVTYKADDVKAAAAVTEQLKDPKTAAAGLEAYAALTDAQKQLVNEADLVAAQEIVAAAELKDAQDDAAVSKTRNASKTVKAGKNGKTTKKQSITLKKITSASGAKVTYKKVSGKKAITVKSGKAYLAKGVKKGTYKATVKATCGTQTAKITVKFTVKA